MIKSNFGKWEELEIKQLPYMGDCRYCKHAQWRHPLNTKIGYPCTANSDLDAKACSVNVVTIFVPSKKKESACPCMEYIPGDNLAYLEYMSSKGV